MFAIFNMIYCVTFNFISLWYTLYTHNVLCFTTTHQKKLWEVRNYFFTRNY